MKGLERITQRIQTDAQGQIEALTAAGRRQAQEITEKYEDQARQLRQADQEKAARDAQQDQRRAQSGADRTRREQLLACKQQLIDDTFRQARQQLTQLPREKYVHLLVQLAVKNGAGTEEIILSPEDAPLGQQVLEGANAQGRHFRLSAEQRPTGGGADPQAGQRGVQLHLPGDPAAAAAGDVRRGRRHSV